MNKKAKFTYRGINQDINKAKHPGEFYYDGRNIRIINTTSQDSNALSNEKGNELVMELPSVNINLSLSVIEYGSKTLSFVNSSNNELINSSLPYFTDSQIIIGHAVTRDSIILFSTDDKGFDCIWELNEFLEGGYDLELLYCRNLNFSTSRPIDAVFNYENEIIQKIYWVDGNNQIRFLNIKASIENGDIENLIDIPSNSINTVGDYDLSQAVISAISGGGIHTSGMIQYAYNLYKINGSQTTISPLSDLIALDNGLVSGGGELNEIVGATPTMVIPSLDDNYTNIKVYAIKYTSFNQIPSISLIKDERIDNYVNYSFSDNGNIINEISLSEFLFLGSNPIIPRHIASKDNRLLAADFKENAYDIDVDMRAYSHNSARTTVLYTGNIVYNGSSITGLNNVYYSPTPVSTYNYSKTADAINPNYDVYKYQKNGTTIGGEGPFVKYSILQVPESELTRGIKYTKLLKDEEIYRIGIQFYNKLGQKSDAKWIADFKTPKGNLSDNHNILKVELLINDLNAYLDTLNLSEDDRPVGYKILRADRQIKDMTILSQGSLTGMMFQSVTKVRDDGFWNTKSNRETQAKQEVKIPVPVSRGFEELSNERTVFPTEHLKQMTGNNGEDGKGEGFDEIYRDNEYSYKNQRSYQFTKMFQLHSPDVLFNTGITYSRGLKLFIKGISKISETNSWTKTFKISTKSVLEEFRNFNTDTLSLSKYDGIQRKDGFGGVIGPNFDAGQGGDKMDFVTYNNKYYNYVEFPSSNLKYDIYGIPEITERGQGVKSYNGNADFNYSNTLESIITDRRKGSSRDDRAINGVNTWGERCLTIVEGTDSDDILSRATLEQILPFVSGGKNGLILAEVRRDLGYVYTNGIYGGNSLEDKTRTPYIEIGEYKNIEDSDITIQSAGDIFIQNFKVGRLLKTDTEVFDELKTQLTETVEFKVETTVNLLNRNDLSLFNFDNKFQPRYDEYHKYNRVYSQSPTLVKNSTDNINFKKAQRFDTRVISSKVKVPGEIIDSWTDYLENETLDLDGKYGPINAMISSKDEIYTLQDKGVAKLSINPRVQTQGSDGIGIELGTGTVLYDYNYLSTESGTLNKWSVFTSPTGFYYLDLINRGLYRVTSGLENLSSTKGLHAYFQNNLDYDKLIIDNPILSSGALGGYDNINADAYITLLQGNKTFTLTFNDKTQTFNSFWDFAPSRYINKGFKLLTPSSTNNNLYSHFEGDYNKFYDEYFPSYITLQINPESDLDCIFDNIEYNSELYLNDIDQPEKTLTHIQAYNEYQDTGRIPLILGRNKNLRRKFRKWRANIPRDGRNRLRNPWIFLKLELDNESNYKLVLHDIIVNYTVI